MRFSLLAAAASLAGLARVAHAAADMFEVNMVFPRPNTTYAPAPHMPFLFSVRNADRARDLHAVIQLVVQEMWGNRGEEYHYIYMTNQSTTTADEIQFRYNFTNLFTTESKWSISWWLHWKTCDEHPRPGFETKTLYSDFNYLDFSTRKDGQAPDLAAAAADSCANGDGGGGGIALALPGEAKVLASPIRTWPDSPVTKCMLVESSTTASEACRATIDAAAAASISSAATAEPPAPSAGSTTGGGKSAGAGAGPTSASSPAGASKTASPADSAASLRGGVSVAGLAAVLGAVGVLMA